MARLPLEPIPDKIAFKIGEAARLVGVKPHVLRFWEQEFGRLRPRKTSSGHRSYTQADLHLLRAIRALLHEHGFTIAGARSLLQKGDAAVQAVLSGVVPESDVSTSAEEIAQLQAQLAEREAALTEAARAEQAAREEAEIWKADALRARESLDALKHRSLQVSARLRGLAAGKGG